MFISFFLPVFALKLGLVILKCNPTLWTLAWMHPISPLVKATVPEHVNVHRLTTSTNRLFRDLLSNSCLSSLLQRRVLLCLSGLWRLRSYAVGAQAQCVQGCSVRDRQIRMNLNTRLRLCSYNKLLIQKCCHSDTLNEKDTIPLSPWASFWGSRLALAIKKYYMQLPPVYSPTVTHYDPVNPLQHQYQFFFPFSPSLVAMVAFNG